MRNLFRSDGGVYKTRTAIGILPLSLLIVVPGCVARHMPDWSRVRAVAPETRTEVQLYKDEAIPGGGRRKLKGRFISATAGSITLQLADRIYTDGQTRTIQKDAVRKVLIARPIWKRWPGWFALAIPFSLLQGHFSSQNGDGPFLGELAWHAMIDLPIAIPFFIGSRKQGIYEVSPEHKDLQRTGQKR